MSKGAKSADAVAVSVILMYLSKTHDSKSLVDQGDTSILGSFPFPSLDRCICLCHVPAKGTDERNAMLSCSNCVGCGRIHHQAPTLHTQHC